MAKSYKPPIETEEETTINVLYGENKLVIYTNNVKLQKQLGKLLGTPKKEDKRGKSIYSSCWEISLQEKTKISKMILKANIFEI